MVARALLLNPSIIVADEPVSMVDASLRATILESLLKAHVELGVSLIYITHDLTTAYQVSQTILMLYQGSWSRWETWIKSSKIHVILIHNSSSIRSHCQTRRSDGIDGRAQKCSQSHQGAKTSAANLHSVAHMSCPVLGIAAAPVWGRQRSRGGLFPL